MRRITDDEKYMNVRVKSKKELNELRDCDGNPGLETTMIDDYAGKIIKVERYDDYFGNHKDSRGWLWSPMWFRTTGEFHMKEIDV